MFLLPFNIILLVSLVKYLRYSGIPISCALIYIGAKSFFRLIPVIFYGYSFINLVISAIIGIAFSYLYFKLLDKLEDGALWWVTSILGGFILIYV